MVKITKNQKAFTLAEVLITLLIIGVIASLIIPNLINDARDAELKTAWKKTFSDMDQATRKIMMDNGGTMKGLCSQFDHNCLKNIYLPYLSVIKSCSLGSSYGNCWVNGDVVWLNNVSMNTWGNNAGIVLNNGVFIDFYNDSITCSASVGSLSKCARLRADVNGFKGPNKVGKDVFVLTLMENGIKPGGIPGDGQEPSTTCINGGIGFGCAALYLYQ
jgi:prepilin-type N-terminal cleavage/methylation domain-containing protein